MHPYGTWSWDVKIHFEFKCLYFRVNWFNEMKVHSDLVLSHSDVDWNNLVLLYLSWTIDIDPWTFKLLSQVPWGVHWLWTTCYDILFAGSFLPPLFSPFYTCKRYCQVSNLPELSCVKSQIIWDNGICPDGKNKTGGKYFPVYSIFT